MKRLLFQRRLTQTPYKSPPRLPSNIVQRHSATPESSSSGRPHYRGMLIAFSIACFLVYFASPYYSIWRFSETIRAHDMNALAARVDFNDVRSSP